MEIIDSVDFTKRLGSCGPWLMVCITIVTIYADFIDGGLVKNTELFKNV